MRHRRFKQSFGEEWTRQTFGNHEWVVAECCKEFSQHFGLFRVLRHAIHFSL
jgi:hypothetical protein